MNKQLPAELSDLIPGRWIGQPPESITNGFHQDSREIQPGQGFVALTCGERDGHDYVEDAASRGASMALVERAVSGVAIPQYVVDSSMNSLVALQLMANRWRERFPGSVIGITGSCGKTSTKELLTHLLGEENTCMTPGNRNNLIGLPLTLTHLDTQRHQCAVVEAGINEPGEMSALARILHPDISLLTMIGRAHIEKLHTRENIAAEKSELMAQSKSDSPVIMPKDCLSYEALRAYESRAILISEQSSYDEDTYAPQCLEEVVYQKEMNSKGDARLRLRWEKANREVFYVIPPLWGPGMISNAVLAIVTAYYVECAEETMQERLLTWEPASQRGEWKGDDERLYYVDCYNANPESYYEFFTVARNLPAHSARLYILGGMAELGEQSARLHWEVGKQLMLRSQDAAILVGDDTEYLQEGLLAAGNRAERLYRMSSTESIQRFIESFDGVVMLKGSRAWSLERTLPETASPRKDPFRCDRSKTGQSSQSRNAEATQTCAT